MRLLEYGEDGRLTITSFNENAIPPYAILSHTWGADTEEVTFVDLAKGDGKHKPGYAKIRFCGEQAQQDGLQYFWVDTCCIDKSDKVELSHAIQSMFRWYQDATKCYVYLSDVSTEQTKAGGLSTEFTWEPAFRSSRWFTRGWTLQELLAPSIVEFFSQEWEKLGDKVSLNSLIHRITGIPQEVLTGALLYSYRFRDVLRWAEGRETKLEEDKIYSLQGIIGVEVAPMYGEGAASALRRLMDEIHTLAKCLSYIHSTDPRNDKKRIEVTEGGLLADSYRWVLENTTFRQWQQSPHDRLLWVKGDPGKGKTMLLCGIINELQSSMPRTALISYFFCQATDSRINNATAALRGLLYMLVSQQPSLALHSSASSRVKWIVSSRNWPDIEARLEQAGHKVKLSLELNAKSVAAAVDVFIRQKVDQLAHAKTYNEELRHAVLQHLKSNANDTFLWVAPLCQDLKATSKRHVLNKLALFPYRLDSLYRRMMQQITKSDDAETCRCVLATVAVLYRPVTISELVALVKQLEGVSDDVREIISLCGSFLTLREDTVYFVHQSAKDFLFAKAYGELFPDGAEDVHRAIFSKSLATLFSTLHRDMYSLKEPGIPIENAKPADPGPLAAARYSCVYWIDHLCDSKPASWVNSVSGLQVAGVIDGFLKNKYLYWLEGLSLCKSIAKGVVSMARLKRLVEIWNADELQQHVQDAQRFIMYHKGAIESYPLQVYACALLFSPTKSLIRRLFQHEEPKGISIKPTVDDNWSACLQTLEGHTEPVTSVAFSHDSARLASASDDKTVKIWDASSGACLQTLEGHSNGVSSVAFSHDSARLASASDDSTVKIWDASSGACLQTLQIGKTLKSVSFDATGAFLHTEIGTIALQSAEGPSMMDVTEPERSLYVAIGLSPDSIWIKHNGENMLWIPSEYRPSCSSISETAIGVGNGSGRVWLCRINI